MKSQSEYVRTILPKINSLEDCLKYQDICLYILENNIINETTIIDNNVLTNKNQRALKLISDKNNKIDSMNKCVMDLADQPGDINVCSENFDYKSSSYLNKIQAINERISELKNIKLRLSNFENVEPVIYNDKIYLNITNNFRAPVEFILPLITTLLIIIFLSLYEFLKSNRVVRNRNN